MRVCCHIADKVLWTWPAIYWAEFITVLLDEGHDVFVFSDDKQVTTDIEHEKLRKCFSFNEEEIDTVIRQCDIFIGVPLRFSDIAKKHGLKIINILGSTTKGCGVKSTAVCTGCLDKGANEIDCSFEDELCYWLITPFDVKREFDKVCA